MNGGTRGRVVSHQLKKTCFLIVNFKCLQRERQEPRYTQCLCDQQINRRCTLNERIQSSDFSRSVNKLPIKQYGAKCNKNQIHSHKMLEANPIHIWELQTKTNHFQHVSNFFLPFCVFYKPDKNDGIKLFFVNNSKCKTGKIFILHTLINNCKIYGKVSA